MRLACMCSSDGSQHVSRPGALSITTQHPGAGERTAQAPEAHPPPPTYLQHAACAHQLLHQVDAVGDAQQQQAGVRGVGQHKQTLHQLLALGACTGQAHASSGCYWASTRKLQLLPVGNSGHTTWGSPHHAGSPSVLCLQLVHHSTSHPSSHPPTHRSAANPARPERQPSSRAPPLPLPSLLRPRRRRQTCASVPGLHSSCRCRGGRPQAGRLGLRRRAAAPAPGAAAAAGGLTLSAAASCCLLLLLLRRLLRGTLLGPPQLPGPPLKG